jgi:prepilin-type N-terminal cleavage/methylation domain-containing protein
MSRRVKDYRGISLHAPEWPKGPAAGFTLIELLVAVGILAVLAGVVILNIGSFFGEGIKTKSWGTEQHQVSSAVGLYMVANNTSTIEAFDVGPLPLGKKVLDTYLLGELAYRWHVAADGSVTEGDPALVWYSNFANAQGIDGTVSGATTVAGLQGNALRFDGINDYVYKADDPSLDLSTAGTIISWINAEEIKNWAAIVHKGVNKNWSDEAYSLQFNDKGKVGLSMNNGKSQTWSSLTLLPNTWYQVVATWDAGVKKVYVNGALVGSSKNSATPINSSGGLVIGGQSNQVNSGTFWNKTNMGFKGTIDEVSLYKRALSDQEIADNYKSLKP